MSCAFTLIQLRPPAQLQATSSPITLLRPMVEPPPASYNAAPAIANLKMPSTLLINRKHITLEEAKNSDINVINELRYTRATQQLDQELLEQTNAIVALTKHHLRLNDRDVCSILPQHTWIHGNFNVCIPIHVASGNVCKKFMLRCPMPHKLAEAQYHGTVDEKLRCEVAMYAWMQENCTDIRIPHLYGFGFVDHNHFTHEDQRPWYIRLAHKFKRYLHRILRYPTLSRYITHRTESRLSTAYMLLENVGPDIGEMLSNTWEVHRYNASHRHRLFQGLAHIILSLARIPQPRIGSLQFQNDGTIVLTNRPLTCSIMILENEGAPRTIQRKDTYLSTESFVADILTFHDNYFLSNLNAIDDDTDCYSQMATKALLRALSHHYIRREQRNGPFFLQFTDLHASNIFVDGEWNITCLLDLEWICALPVEMLSVPHWLAGHELDEIKEDFKEFDGVRQEFMSIFEDQEKRVDAQHPLSLTEAMNVTWDSGGVWFWHCIESVNAMLRLVDDYICPQFSVRRGPKSNKSFSTLWCKDSTNTALKKVADQRIYQQRLELLFSEVGA